MAFLLNDWLFWGVTVPFVLFCGMFIANTPLWAETWKMHKRHYRVSGGRAFLRFVGMVLRLRKTP